MRYAETETARNGVAASVLSERRSGWCEKLFFCGTTKQTKRKTNGLQTKPNACGRRFESEFFWKSHGFLWGTFFLCLFWGLHTSRWCLCFSGWRKFLRNCGERNGGPREILAIAFASRLWEVWLWFCFFFLEDASTDVDLAIVNGLEAQSTVFAQVKVIRSGSNYMMCETAQVRISTA